MSGRIIDGELEHLRAELRQRDEEIARLKSQIDTSRGTGCIAGANGRTRRS